jgi:hypothetical protein
MWTARHLCFQSRKLPRRPTRRCSEPHHHKVRSRGRPRSAHGLLPRARVLNGQRAVAELGS